MTASLHFYQKSGGKKSPDLLFKSNVCLLGDSIIFFFFLLDTTQLTYRNARYISRAVHNVNNKRFGRERVEYLSSSLFFCFAIITRECATYHLEPIKILVLYFIPIGGTSITGGHGGIGDKTRRMKQRAHVGWRRKLKEKIPAAFEDLPDIDLQRGCFQVEPPSGR